MTSAIRMATNSRVSLPMMLGAGNQVKIILLRRQSHPTGQRSCRIKWRGAWHVSVIGPLWDLLTEHALGNLPSTGKRGSSLPSRHHRWFTVVPPA